MEFPSKLGEQRRLLSCGLEGPRDTATFGYAGTFASLGVDDSFSLSKFRQSCKLEIKEFTNARVIFELIGVDVAVANAIRRILISEVPTIAIETIHMYQNTGVIQDEVLAHRLGLIPLKIDPILLEWRGENEDLTEENSLKLKLHVKCTENDILPHLKHMPVFTKDLQWVPWSKKQKEKFGDDPPVAVEPEILITKLRPGQEIEAELFCEKGIGQTHAKWSPVATAVYRLLPVFSFPKGPIEGAEAAELKQLCPMGVFDVEDIGGASRAVAARPRNCTTCRACLERFPDQVVLQKVKDHFIFTVESTGCIPAPQLFELAVAVLKEKATKIKANLCASMSRVDQD